jgi:hypothetical protein
MSLYVGLNIQINEKVVLRVDDGLEAERGQGLVSDSGG